MRLEKLFATDRSWVSLILRVVTGLVILPHGLQKLAGAFGGYGFDGTMGYFTGALGIPAPLAFLVIVAESFGALALVAGLLTRPAAIGLTAVMAGAVALVHWPVGFFMDWSGTSAGEGFEYHLLVMGTTIALAVFGAGRFSIDRVIAARLAPAPHAGDRHLAPEAQAA